MKKSIFLIFVSSILLFSCKPKKSKPLRIATAANMQFAMDALTKVFTEETGILCETIVSSSGKITAQIQAGAPYDVFVSADMKYPTTLYQAGLTQEAPFIYAKGNLVLWTLDPNLKPSMASLTHPDVKHIALANPKIAPYGAAALEVLQKEALLKDLDSKLVFGESIAQTNQFILSQAADIGFTAKSVVLSPLVKGKGRWTEIDTASYTPISQGIVLVKSPSRSSTTAQQFKEFLISPKGKGILATFGYFQ